MPPNKLLLSLPKIWKNNNNNKPLPRILLRGCTVFPPPRCEPFCEVVFIALNIFGEGVSQYRTLALTFVLIALNFRVNPFVLSLKSLSRESFSLEHAVKMEFRTHWSSRTHREAVPHLLVDHVACLKHILAEVGVWKEAPGSLCKCPRTQSPEGSVLLHLCKKLKGQACVSVRWCHDNFLSLLPVTLLSRDSSTQTQPQMEQFFFYFKSYLFIFSSRT